jgi:asparaginyl-tRNA synthetase
MTQPTLATLGQFLDQEIQITVWLSNKRSSGKIHFLQVRDGSGFCQATVFKGDVDEETFVAAKHLTQEQAFTLVGTVKADDRAAGGFEIGVRSLEAHAPSAGEYPITPKEHGVDFLLERRHLWLRHKRPWAILRIRDAVQTALHNFFHDQGFVRFDAPFFTPSAAEGTTNLFEIDLFDEDKAYLSQSGQLYAEAGALAMGKVYTFGPTFRAEKSKTRRHLLEFWMLEPEVAPSNHVQNMDLQESMVSHVVGHVLAHCSTELNFLERDTSKLEPAAAGNFPRITYTAALEILKTEIAKQRSGEKPFPPNVPDTTDVVEWGDDFGAPHETILGHYFDRPVIIERYPAHFKAFYMQPDPQDPRLALCDDMIAPDGYGEIIGGSERIHDYELLKQRLEEHNLPLEAFEWYLDLRRFGSVPHAGYGLGLERLVAWICGIDHLREAIPFPRMLTRMYP